MAISLILPGCGYKDNFNYIGHIVRAGPQDPMGQVVFQPNSLSPRKEETTRVGKPRAHWLIQTYADAFRKLGIQNGLKYKTLNIETWLTPQLNALACIQKMTLKTTSRIEFSTIPEHRILILINILKYILI